MFILNGMGTEIINSDYVKRFTTVVKEDATLISAVFSDGLVTIGRYAEKQEAELAMTELLEALSDNAAFFMRSNTGRYLPQKKTHCYHGKKEPSHGGS